MRFDDGIFYFSSLQDLIQTASMCAKLTGNGINIIGKHSFIKDLINELVRENGFEITNAYFYSSDVDGYDKEYILSTVDKEVWVEKYYRDDKPLLVDEPIFVHADCNSKILRDQNHGKYTVFDMEY